MELERFDDARAFLDAAGPFLREREAEHNLIYGVCSTLIADPTVYSEEAPYLALVRDGDGSVAAAALRTPPFQLVLSEVDDPAALEPILRDRLEAGDELPAVLTPAGEASRFAREWATRRGRRAVLATRERIFRLSRVEPPRPTGGRMRTATAGDVDLLVDWLAAFWREAIGDEEPDLDRARLVAGRWAEGRHRLMYLWEDGGRPVSMSGVGGETPHGIRVGPVYTPPHERGRGYASNLVARASQAQLDAGRRFCFLFTDLANPTSNKIYQAIGYEPVRDVEQYRFELPEAGA
ncbi:MAG TPA: GNAT family N-acetyltransferase [Candidatus Limnocylindria bacterium]|nr:GNAT family N-acetyltransferase [Candidatus Limnocylindria bacterium]